MSRASLEIEFLATTSITEAIKEAKEKARMLNFAYITFDFNGIKLSIGKNVDIKKAVDDFHNVKSDFKFVIHP